jgi:hypothetical protein
MFGTLEVIVLYLVVAMVIFGFLAALYATTKHRTDVPMGGAEWGPTGIGKVYPSTPWPKDFGLSKIQWSYPSAHCRSQSAGVVHFDDPADAYEYVVKALVSKNQMIERLENATWKGLPSTYEWLWLDAHVDREYWMEQLNEFKEDC